MYAITPDVKQFAEDVLRNGSVPGLTLGVVHSNGVVELEQFGRKTEDGATMTTDVSVQVFVQSYWAGALIHR